MFVKCSSTNGTFGYYPLYPVKAQEPLQKRGQKIITATCQRGPETKYCLNLTGPLLSWIHSSYGSLHKSCIRWSRQSINILVLMEGEIWDSILSWGAIDSWWHLGQSVFFKGVFPIRMITMPQCMASHSWKYGQHKLNLVGYLFKKKKRVLLFCG